MERATAEIGQACNTISMYMKEFAKIAQFKSSIKFLEGNLACYEASEEDLKRELPVLIKKALG